MTSQKELPIGYDSIFLSEFFVTESNRFVYKAIINTQHKKPVILIGPKHSGKTHLAKTWLSDGIYIDCSLGKIDLLGQVITKRVVLDNIHEINSDTFINFLHIINLCNENGSSLVMTSRKEEFLTDIQDLTSRINASYKIIIPAPDAELIEIMMKKFCFDNKMTFNEKAWITLKEKKLVNTFADILRLKNNILVEKKWSL